MQTQAPSPSLLKELKIQGNWLATEKKYFPFKEALSVFQLQKWLNLNNCMKCITGMSRSVRYIHTYLAPPGFYVSQKERLKLLLSHSPVRNGCSIAGATPHQEDEAISQHADAKWSFHVIPFEQVPKIHGFPQLKELLSICRCGSTAGAWDKGAKQQKKMKQPRLQNEEKGQYSPPKICFVALNLRREKLCCASQAPPHLYLGEEPQETELHLQSLENALEKSPNDQK